MITKDNVQDTFDLSPLDLGLRLKECVQEIQRVEAVCKMLKTDEDTVLSREVIEALDGEVTRQADQLILVKLRLQGKTLDHVLSAVISPQ